MEDFNQMNRSGNGAAQTSEHNPSDLRIIEEQRSQIDDLRRRLERLEAELEHQHHERACVVADYNALKKEMEMKAEAEDRKRAEAQCRPAPGDICLNTEVEFPKEYYANALAGLVPQALELLSGIHTLACSLRKVPSEECNRQFGELLDNLD